MYDSLRLALVLMGFNFIVSSNTLIQKLPMYVPISFQSRRWPGSAISNKTFDNDDLLDRELPTISRFIALSSKQDETGVAIIPALKISKKENNTWNRRPLDEKRLQVWDYGWYILLWHLKYIHYNGKYRAQSFTSLKAGLRQDINRVSSFSKCLNGTVP